MATPASTMRYFIDESGGPDPYDPARHKPHDRYFTIAVVAIAQPDYLEYKRDIKSLCKKYEKYIEGCEIKSYSIRYSNPVGIKPKSKPAYKFYLYPEGLNEYLNFNSDLKTLLAKTNFQVLSVSTDKSKAAKEFPHRNVHKTLMTDLWERIALSVIVDKHKKIKIVFDPTQGSADELMFETYHQFKDQGSWYFGKARMESLNLAKYIFPVDSESSFGVQLADLCANPIKNYHQHGKYDFFEKIVRPKLYPYLKDHKYGKYINMGTKISLNRLK